MSTQEEDIEQICPNNQTEWRQWLEKNHEKKQAVWLIYYKKQTKKTSMNWSDAVDEALCFGWIDSVRKTIDEERFIQFFSKRKPRSVWSKINKEKVARLIESGKMSKEGFVSIEKAKGNGYWTILDDVEELIVPDDLEKEFKKWNGSKEYYLSLSKSIKKMILYWVVMAKRPETRQKRIAEIAELAAQGKKPKHIL